MIRLGFLLRAAFQIQDDIRNQIAVGGAPYGKEPLGDLPEGKRTLMPIHVHAAADARGRGRIERCLAAPRQEPTFDDAAWVARARRATGARPLPVRLPPALCPRRSRPLRRRSPAPHRRPPGHSWVR